MSCYGLEHVLEINLGEGGSGIMLRCHNCGDRVDHVIGTIRAALADEIRHGV